MRLTRREFAAASVALGTPPQAGSFPKSFLWGAATAAHQVEGNNINSDMWVLEHVKPTIFQEPSGDACDHYHRYAEDIRMLARLGIVGPSMHLCWFGRALRWSDEDVS